MKQLSRFWTHAEVDTSEDYEQFQKLGKGEQLVIKGILAFFANFDQVVNENISFNMYDKIKCFEGRASYAIQFNMEHIHAMMYNLLIDAYFKDPDEREELYAAAYNFKILNKMRLWVEKWIGEGTVFEEKLLTCGCIEAIIFSGAFAVIYKYKEDGILPGLTMANELISIDEGFHVENAYEIYSWCSQLRDDIVYQIVDESVNLSDELYTEFIPTRLVSMSSKHMGIYTRFLANRFLVQLGYDELYEKVYNPFDFMEKISQRQKSNFFELRVTEYEKVTTVVENYSKKITSLLEDF